MASDIPGTDQRSSDSFSNALEVAQAAITATKQVYQAEDRTRYIEELALKAHGEVRRLRNVAQSLASTAVSVANMALDLCGYDSYRRAFREHPEYQDIVSYQDFVNLAAGQSSRSHKGVDSLVPDPSHNGWLPNRQYDWLDEGRCYNQRRHRNNYPEEDKKWYYGPNGRDQEGQEMVLNSWDDTDDLVEPLRQQMKVRSKRPGSGRQYKQGPTYNEEEDFAEEKSKAKVDSTERFPSSTPDEYRCQLATSFENTSCIAPLWEDRYVDVKDRESSSVQNTGRWNEKKAMKQFQIKLKQTKLDDTVSAEDTLCSSHVQARRSSSATPENYARSPGSLKDQVARSLIQASASESAKLPRTKPIAIETGVLPTDNKSTVESRPEQVLEDPSVIERNGGNPGEDLVNNRLPEKVGHNPAHLDSCTFPEQPCLNSSKSENGQCAQFVPLDVNGEDASKESNGRTNQEWRSHSSYSNQASNSSDSEVEEIMKEPKVLRHLHKMEYHQPMTRLVPPRTTRQTRPISPLLSSNEKENYSLSGEESPLSPASTPPPLRYRQVYRPLSKTETHLETIE